jgi:hypothetical protein
MNENDFEYLEYFEYYKEETEIEETGFFVLSFVNEKILLEKINGDKIEEDKEEYTIDLKSVVSLSQLYDFEINSCYNYNYLINLSNKFNISSFTNEVFFDANEYISKIYKSYKMNWENIYYQYKKDFKRQNIFVDKNQIYSRKVFEKFTKTSENNKYLIDSEVFLELDYNKLFIMLTAQSSYYFMYLYSKIFENKFRKLYNNPELYIVNGPTKTIQFENKENKENKEINFCAILTLFVKDIDDDKKVLNIIYLELNIIFSLLCKIRKENNYGILYTMIL